MHRTLLSLIAGAAALACAPSLAHADPQDRRRTVYVYDGYDTYRVSHPRRVLRRVFGQPKRTRHRAPQPVYAPPARSACSTPQPVYAPPQPVYAPPQPVYAPPAPPAYRTLPLLPEHRADRIACQLERYRNHPRTQLRVLADWTRGYQVTLEQILCLTELVCASADRAAALVQLYPQLDGRCCLDYVGRTQHLLTPCDRQAYACQIAALRPACAHGPAEARGHGRAGGGHRDHVAQTGPQRVVVVERSHPRRR